jgi:thiol-disulfide isomerase/thioredoxin
MRISMRKCLIGVFCLLCLSTVIPVTSRAEIDFFQAPEERQSSTIEKSPASLRAGKIAKVLFFIAPGCSTCPDEAAKLEKELTSIGLKYQIEGIFVGDPTQVGKYLAELRTYPFNFELGLDMDGRIGKQYGVKTFPTTIIEVDGKRIVATNASKLSEKLR